jgi:hypothetical protein
VSGRLIPLKENPVPLGAICEIVRAEPPEFVRVSASVVLPPVATLPKLRLVGFAVSWPGVMPVPDRGTFRAGLDAFEVIARLPLAPLPDVGANAILKLALWPAFKVIGKLRPMRLNPEPVALAAEMVTLAPPELVMVSARVWEVPTWTLPKPRLVGLVVSWPRVMPVPDRGTFRAGLDAFEVIARLPLTLLPEVGANVVLRLTLWPAFRVIGKLKPLTLNPEPVALAAEMVTLAPPELVMVSARVWEVPTWTLPKPRLAGLVVSWPEVAPVPETGNVTVPEVPDAGLKCPLPFEV